MKWRAMSQADVFSILQSALSLALELSLPVLLVGVVVGVVGGVVLVVVAGMVAYKLVMDPASSTARRVEVEQTVGLQGSAPAPAATIWQLFSYTGQQGNQVQEYTETVTDSTADSGALSRLAALEPLWGALAHKDVGPVIHARWRTQLRGERVSSIASIRPPGAALRPASNPPWPWYFGWRIRAAVPR